MSRKTQIPVSTLFERLKGYRGREVKRYTTILDFPQMGYQARARVLFKARKEERQGLKEALLKCPYTNELYKVNNGYDLMAELIFRSMQELETYLDQLRAQYSIEREETFYIIDELKREEFLGKSQTLLIGHTGRKKDLNIIQP